MVYVGMDYGRARTGIAVSLEGVVLPLPHVEGGWERIEERLDAISENRGDITVVLGLPLSASGKRTEMTDEVEAFAERLRRRGYEVVLEREAGTTIEARETFSGRLPRGFSDSSAACLILKRYLKEP